MVLRHGMAPAPVGRTAFRMRMVESLYFQPANNAVLGAKTGTPFLSACFEILEPIPLPDWVRRSPTATRSLRTARVLSLSTGSGDLQSVVAFR